MTSSKRTGFALYGNYELGQLDWNQEYNDNWNRLSHLVYGSLNTNPLTPLNAEPAQSLRVPGNSFFMNVAGALPSEFRQFANKIIVWEDGGWVGHEIKAGLIVHSQDTNGLYLYSGTAWSQMDITPYVHPEAVWFKRLRTQNSNFGYHAQGVNALATANILSSSSSSSSSRPFNEEGTCRIPGLYQINSTITIDPPSVNNAFRSQIVQIVGSVDIISANTIHEIYTDEPGYFTIQASALVSLALGDKIENRLLWNSGTITIISEFNNTKLDILKVG